MPSIAISETALAVTAATATGELTVASNAGVYPGTFGWLALNSGASSMRVEIVRLVGTTKLLVRGAPDGTEGKIGAPSYGLKSALAYNGASTLFIEAQTAPVSAAHAARNIG